MRTSVTTCLSIVLLSNQAIAQQSENFLVKSRAVTVSAYPVDGVVLGQGWDSFLEQKTGGACVTGSMLAVPGQEITYKFDKIEDIEQIFNTLQISASAKFKAFGAGAELSSSFSKSLRVDSRALNMMAVVKIDRGGAFLAPHFSIDDTSPTLSIEVSPASGSETITSSSSSGSETTNEPGSKTEAANGPTRIDWSGKRTISGGGLRLTDQALAALKLDLGEDLTKPNRAARPTNFRRICGDQFVAAIHTGGELLGVLNIIEKSREKKEALAISLKVTGMSGSGDASINTSLTEIQKSNGLRFDSFQRGGNPNILVTNLDDFISKVKNFASFDNFIPHPYTINTMQYSSLENWPAVDDPSRETEYLNQLANLYARFSQLKSSYDEVIVNTLSPAVTVETNPDKSVLVKPVLRSFDLKHFGGADVIHKYSEQTHELLNIYADHLESCFLKNDCNIESELALQSSSIAISTSPMKMNLTATMALPEPSLTSVIRALPVTQISGLDPASQPKPDQVQLDSISAIASRECDEFEPTVSIDGGKAKVRRMLADRVANRLSSMALSFGAETALKGLTRGEYLFAPTTFDGRVVYCEVNDAGLAEEQIQKLRKRLSPFALYYQLVAQLPPIAGEIPFDTLIDTTGEVRRKKDNTLEVIKKDSNGALLPADSPDLRVPILQRGEDALRWWLVTERLLPISKSFCDEKYGHPMCFSLAELREIAEAVQLDLTVDMFINAADVVPPPQIPKPKPKAKKEYRTPRWDGPCPRHVPCI